MLLAIDTSGRRGGVALARYDGEFAIIAGEAALEGGQYSSHLLPSILELLRSADASFADFSAIAAITGPGSFTGLRVGLSTIKGLCEAHSLPIVPVTMLELLAAFTSAERVTALLDAGRKEVYAGTFRRKDEQYTCTSEILHRITDLSITGLAITPDISVARALGCVQVPYPSPTDLAHYAVRKLANGISITADALDAHYIRRSDAEIALQR